MLGSINPLGERARGSRWSVTVSAFLVGSTTAGGALGGSLGWVAENALGPLASVEEARLSALAVVIALGVALDLGLLGPRLPGPRRQVSDAWLYSYRGWVYGVGFGFQLGLGFVTIVAISAVYAAFAAAFLAASFFGGAVIGATFGLVRASTALTVAGVRRPDQMALVDGTLRKWDRPSRRWALASEIALLAASAVAVVV